MARRSLRITRFSDQGAFSRSVDLLAALYPERARDEFESALARLPALLTHDADERAADALSQALEKRGARVRISEAEGGVLPGWEDPAEETTGPEIDASFLSQKTATIKPPPRSHRAMPTGPPRAGSAGSGRVKAPWEE